MNTKNKSSRLSLNQVQIKADPRDYYLVWFNDIPEDCSTGVVGRISNYSNPDIKITLEIADEWLLENRRHGMTLYIDPDGDTISAGIIMTKSEFDRMYREGKGFSSIWHETGHFHTTKYFLDYLNGDQSRLRSEYIRKNQIPPAEYVADLFSLYYAEREDIFEDFKMRIRARYKLIGLDDNARGAWNELRNRRDALKIIETDEQIEKELCRVCGVSCIEEL